ncbi:MAG: PCMD domain-containing protein [Prevotellaceae bacterium]|nr:PCMD domain-containing protein [Prevotellaceae bacterium]
MRKIQVQIMAVAAGLAGMSACIKPELPSSEADIDVEKFELPGIKCLEKEIKEGNSIYIKVGSQHWLSLLSICPQIEISKGATITPPLGVAVDLNTVEYVVTAENKKSSKTYTFNLAQEYSGDTVFFPFEGWKVSSEGYYTLNDADWSSGNAGVSLGLPLLERDKIPENYPSQMEASGKKGSAVKLETKLGGKRLPFMNVPVWSGNFFLGSFNIGKALSSTLEATEFGRRYQRKPRCIQGYYKYREGSGRYNDNGTEIDRPDSCSIYAVFYRADQGSSIVTLTAYDVNTSPRILARAELRDGSSTVGDDFHEFSIDFGEYPVEPDFENHTYKLAVVFSSSARGGTPKYENGQPAKTAIYAGKVGSALVVDEVKVINY